LNQSSFKPFKTDFSTHLNWEAPRLGLHGWITPCFANGGASMKKKVKTEILHVQNLGFEQPMPRF